MRISNSSFSPFISRSMLSMATSIALLVGLSTLDAQASSFHLNGDTIYYSGRVESSDPRDLQHMLISPVITL
ncbi:hypothetical protein [Stenotrophomonas sp. MH181796]|uniref:hypothetical protein n=1 Tax=Stenotrophomonas sp. MH181796 TaxID=2339228 RepID=UPI00129CC283|nr:hypothetical protein [Stenotrophomonas sp. MH181796]